MQLALVTRDPTGTIVAGLMGGHEAEVGQKNPPAIKTKSEVRRNLLVWNPHHRADPTQEGPTR